MFHLIKKDILVQKNSLLLSIVLMIFFSITLFSLGSAGLTVGMIAITYQLVLGASTLEEKVNGDIILLSLPIKKSSIVLSKYLSIYVFAAYAILGFYLIHLAVKLSQVPLDMPFTSSAILGSLAAITLYFSICLPIIFKYGYLKSKMIILIVFFGTVFGGSFLVSTMLENERFNPAQKWLELTNNGWEWMLLLGIPLLLLLGISYFVSLTFYKKREF